MTTSFGSGISVDPFSKSGVVAGLRSHLNDLLRAKQFMSGPCHAQYNEQARTLKLVMFVNLALFIIECSAALIAASTALLGDALDMFADAFVYALSLYALSQGPHWKTRAAAIKGWLMLVFALVVLSMALIRLSNQELLPHSPTMGLIGCMALIGNVYCLWLLARHRGEDINMHSVWVCSRNDIIANVGVLLAAVAVWYFHSPLPDTIVALAIATLFMCSASDILRRAGRDSRSYGQSQSLVGTASAVPSGSDQLVSLEPVSKIKALFKRINRPGSAVQIRFRRFWNSRRPAID